MPTHSPQSYNSHHCPHRLRPTFVHVWLLYAGEHSPSPEWTVPVMAALFSGLLLVLFIATTFFLLLIVYCTTRR